MFRRLPLHRLALTLVGLMSLLPTPGRTDEPSTGVEVRFDTADGVELHGIFHPGPKGKASLCALLLHDLNSHCERPDWERLAEALHKDGLAVLRFDFRGHGRSIAVDRPFWEVPANQALLRGRNLASAPETILATDFPRGYHAMLVNDIAAARLFLESRNDARECNLSGLVVIGTGEGSTLGALWIASEYQRHQASDSPVFTIDSDTEGEELACAVWLGLSPTLQERRVPVLDWVRLAGKENNLPTAFLAGARDKTSLTFAERCVTAVRGRESGRELTASHGVTNTARRGEALLASNLGTATLVRNYVANALRKRGPDEWVRRDPVEQMSCWTFRNAPPILAKGERERTLRLLPLSALGVR
jgi:pimeloyl-ACP methyl ester carboxylesterase